MATVPHVTSGSGLLEMINEVDSLPHYTFNVNNTWLFWKKMPDWSYIAKRGEEYVKFQCFKEQAYIPA